MKRLMHGLVLIPILVLGLTARGAAQLPPAPTLGPPGVCPAVARFDYDVSSIDGADRAQWQLRRGAAGQSFEAATQVDDGVETTTTGSVERDLRAFGPVLDGTRYFFRVRARWGLIIVSAFSAPVVFEADVSPDGMFTASAGSSPGSLRVDWNLTGPIAGCADVVVLRVDKAGGSASLTQAELVSAGSTTIDLTPHGAGDYDVRLHGQFEGGGPDDAVGRESPPVRVPVRLPPALAIDNAAFPEGNASTTQNVVVRLSTPASQPVSFLIGARPGGTASEGACTAGRDVTFALRTVTLNPGQTQIAVPFTVCGDEVQEPEESFTVGITGPTNATLGNSIAQVTILNDDEAALLTISSFQLQGGVPSVRVAVPITLDATITGPTPTYYRAGVCGSEFTAAPLQAFPATPPPTLPGFTTAGTRIVCYQVRAGTSTSSAVVQDTILVVEPLDEPLDPSAVSRALVLGPPSITSFQVKGGLPFAGVARDVPLNVTFTGSATEFRAEEAATSSACTSSLEGRAFQPFSASTPPSISLHGSGSFGRTPRTVCIQLRNRLGGASAIAQDDIEVVVGGPDMGVLGGGGADPGAGVSRDCVDRLAIGIVAHTGDFVNAIGLLCADLGDNGQHRGITETLPGGGGGGKRAVLDCPSGQVLGGLEVQYGLVIDRITIRCIAWRSDIGANGNLQNLESAGGRGGDHFARQACPIPFGVRSLIVITHRLAPLVEGVLVFCDVPRDF